MVDALRERGRATPSPWSWYITCAAKFSVSNKSSIQGITIHQVPRTYSSKSTMKRFRLATCKGFHLVVKFDKAEHLIPYVWLIRYCVGVAVTQGWADPVYNSTAPSELCWPTQPISTHHFHIERSIFKFLHQVFMVKWTRPQPDNVTWYIILQIPNRMGRQPTRRRNPSEAIIYKSSSY